MLKMSFLAAALSLAASAALAQDYRAQNYDRDGGGHAPYGYGNSTSTLGRFCPPGFYPHSWPSGSGIRCESVDGNVHFQSGL